MHPNIPGSSNRAQSVVAMLHDFGESVAGSTEKPFVDKSNTVEARAKKHPACLQGALGFLDFD
eukprot:8511342-Pyramimonas_sp.AAC.1